MFKKILIVDDHAAVNKGIAEELLAQTAINKIDFAQYCDDAYLKFKKAIKENIPYDLVIVDLTFKADYRKQKIKNGLGLIEAVKHEDTTIKTLVYSVEDRLTKIKALLEKHAIDGFVSKGRFGLKELIEAIKTIAIGKQYISKALQIDLHNNINYEIDDFDVYLLHKLANGLNQKEITLLLKKEHKKPNSLSAVEKRINRLKELLKANNSVHLIAKAKDIGLI